MFQLFHVGDLCELCAPNSKEFGSPIWQGDLVIFINEHDEEQSYVYYVKEGIYRVFFTKLLKRI